MQVDSSKYKSVRQAVQLIFKEEGIAFISRGWAATAVGYAMQGFAKFAAYEALKAAFITSLGVVIIYFHSEKYAFYHLSGRFRILRKYSSLNVLKSVN